MKYKAMSEYPLFIPSGEFKIIKKLAVQYARESIWSIAETIEDNTLFACCKLGTNKQYYSLEEAVRLQKTPIRVKKELLVYLGKKKVEEVGSIIDICSVGRAMLESELPF